MADQISYEDPIWELTATELNVAYLSLSLSKKEIAARLAMTESTVGTHLTKIFEKLGLSEFPDEQKRPLLKEKFGQTLEKIAAEVHEDYQGEYRQRRKEALEKRSDSTRQTQSPEIPSVEPEMDESPPEPRPHSQIRRETGVRRGLAVIAVGLVACIFTLAGVWIIWGIITQAQAPTTTSPAPTSQIQEATNTPRLSPTFQLSPTTGSSQTPEATATLEIPPTAVPLPIREDFSQQYSDMWWVSGNPIVTESIRLGLFSGVLTTDENETTTLLIGNTAWTDYVVSLAVNMPLIYNHFLVGVRVKDLNNMVALDCTYDRICTWIIIHDGEWDTLPTTKPLYYRNFTITVEGNTFTAVVSCPNCSPPAHSTSLVLPSKYEGNFQGGGVLLQITGVMEIDYVEISQLP